MCTVRASSAAGAGGWGAAAVGELATERLVEVAQRAADAAGEVLRKYFRQRVEIIDKEDHSPVTIADREAEEAMVSVILKSFPTHAIFGEENGWRCAESSADYVWVLDPIDGTKSFITGKPLFGTLIALLHNGKPPYDFLSLVPVIEGAGGSITDWRGDRLLWPVTAESRPTSFNVVAAGDARVHKQALDALQWR